MVSVLQSSLLHDFKLVKYLRSVLIELSSFQGFVFTSDSISTVIFLNIVFQVPTEHAKGELKDWNVYYAYIYEFTFCRVTCSRIHETRGSSGCPYAQSSTEPPEV